MADLLVITSRVKKLIKDEGDLNTSAKAMEQISKAVEILCRQGIQQAKADGRKTLLPRDIPID